MPSTGAHRTAPTDRASFTGAGFSLCLVVVALLVFVAPFARPKVMIFLLRSVRTHAPVVTVGNSIWAHVSVCDHDRRTLPEMLQDASAQSTLDLTYGGQPLDEAVQYAALALRNRNVHSVVVGLSLPELSGYDDSDLQQTLLFRLINPGLQQEGLLARLKAGHMLEGRPDFNHEPFSYKGKAYPDYNTVKSLYFEPARNAMPCPESDSSDRSFMEAYYDHAYTAFPVQSGDFDLLASLGAEAAARSKQVVIVLMPLDAELMNSLRPGMGEQALQRAADAARTMRARGLNVLDLSDLLHNDDFADRYCACGHLLEHGRTAVTQRITAALADKSTPAGGR